MKISWRRFLHRLASVVLYCSCGATAWHSAVCHAYSAYDSASDPVYADGWQAGDNGGTGFTPWNFDSSYYWPVNGTWYPYAHADFHAIDDGLKSGTHYSNPFNDIGRSWALGAHPDGDGPPRAGRGFSPLQIGQSLKVVFDNPTDRSFWKGYFIRLNGGTSGVDGNICNAGGVSCTPDGLKPYQKMYLSRFEYFNNGLWTIVDSGTPDWTSTGLYDTDTAAAGALFQVTRTGEDTYTVLLDPFGPGASYTLSETFANPGQPVDWIEFTFFNTETDTGTPPSFETDFYIRSIEITDAPGTNNADFNGSGVVDGADFLKWQRGFGLTGQTTNQNGDANGDGSVNGADLTIWRNQYGGAPLMAVTAVPEPATWIALFVSAGSLLTRGASRRE